MVIHNQIFAYYRENEEKIKNSIEFLKENGYSIYKKEIKETKVV
tara:strand:+ start:1952 stop:2083 length:132 start_codon:yes stop_codon:yes gene_type:complete